MPSKRNCKIGHQCGNACISKTFECTSLKSESIPIGRFVMLAKGIAGPLAEIKKGFKDFKAVQKLPKADIELLKKTVDNIKDKTLGVIERKLEENKLPDEEVDRIYNRIIYNSPDETREYLEKNPVVVESIRKTLAYTAGIGGGKDPEWDKYAFDIVPNLVVQGHKVNGYHDKDNKRISIERVDDSVITIGAPYVANAFAHEIAHGVEIKVGPDKMKEALDAEGILYDFEGSMGMLKVSEGELTRKYAKGAYKDDSGELYATELVATLFELLDGNTEIVTISALLNSKGIPKAQLNYAWRILFDEPSPWSK
jgi:hypothetical protein